MAAPQRGDLYSRLSVPGASVTHHERWISVDALRAIAALMVLVSHAGLLALAEPTGVVRTRVAARRRRLDLLRRERLPDRRTVPARAARGPLDAARRALRAAARGAHPARVLGCPRGDPAARDRLGAEPLVAGPGARPAHPRLRPGRAQELLPRRLVARRRGDLLRARPARRLARRAADARSSGAARPAVRRRARALVRRRRGQRRAGPGLPAGAGSSPARWRAGPRARRQLGQLLPRDAGVPRGHGRRG